MFGIFSSKKNNLKNVINDSWSPKFKALVRRCNELNTDLFEIRRKNGSSLRILMSLS